jgi:hypothetical protein
MRYGYFVLQARATGHQSFQLVLEDLATGEKREFASTADLSRFLDRWKDNGRDTRFQRPDAAATSVDPGMAR